MNKILTQKGVHELGLDKIPVITADMLQMYTNIGDGAFSFCTGLTSVEIPNSIISIGGSAFSDCYGLTSVIIPSSVTRIGDYAFYNCSNITSVVWNAKNCNSYNFGSQVTSFIFGNDVEVIPAGICFGMYKLNSIKIPANATSIGNEAFWGCIGLTSVTIPNSVTSIGYGAFKGCSGLTSVTIPNSVTSIGENAFYECSSLTSVTIPNSVIRIGNSAFGECSSLTSVTIGNSVTSIGEWAFSWCSSLTSVTIPNSVTRIGIDAFYNCNCLISVIIGDKTYEKQAVVNGKCKAYKAFKANMTCRDFRYKEGKTYEFEGEPILCECGFHACLSLLDVFVYYWGEFGKDIVVYEVELEGVSNKRNKYDSKVVAKKITIGKRIL